MCLILSWQLCNRDLPSFQPTFHPQHFSTKLALLRTKSHSEKLLELTCLLYWASNLLFNNASLMHATSFLSSAKSNSDLMLSSMFSLSQLSTLHECSPISIGIIASIPYVNLNGDSPVVECEVVLHAYRTCGSFSTQHPLAESNLFLNPLKITLFAASANPFVCRCLTEENFYFISKPSSSSLKFFPKN